jgi:hypothetical protein
MSFIIETGIAIPSGRGAYNFAEFTEANQAAFVPAEERGKKAASLRASARRYTEETGIEFVVRASEKAGVKGVYVWRVTPSGQEQKPEPAAAPAAPEPAKGIPRAKK